MKLVTISGPPSSGKTAVLAGVIRAMMASGLKVGALKYDCLTTNDDEVFRAIGVPVQTGLSGNLCPDHYFVSNIEECLDWGIREDFDFLFSESAGLCNRCAPHIKGVLAVCVIDNLMGATTPKKIGPMLKYADIVVITKGDIVSQAEREVFAFQVRRANPRAKIMHVNGEKPDTELRFSLEYKLVAQLSQNMNFVMDTTVAEFVAMHAESRMVEKVDEVVREIVTQANLLAGEPFTATTPVTSLSGGQSRALMIADTAFLSSSPVVLIDEIENAGIDRKKALSLLVRKEKIVLMATHDPILALMAERRLVIRNGGILKVITTTPKEKENLEKLEALDNRLLALRTRLRSGELIEDAG
jgi:Ni2+-binding GTPase involved in maturation of urease and hydrogenase